MNRILKYGFWLIVSVLTSCHDFLEPKSQTEYVPKLVKSLDELLLGEVYMGPGIGDGAFYSVLGLFDDDVAIRKEWNANNEEAGLNNIRLTYTWAKDMKDNFSNYNIYGEVYKKIVGCNSVLDYIDDVQGTEIEKNRVMGQALAFRGYFYFHLVNLYGQPYSFNKNALGVPLKLNSKLSTGGMPRNTVEEVYTRIVKDLQEAERLYTTLPEDEQNLHNNRINLPCIQLILSRVYLYMENWEQALAYGEKVIKDYNYEIMDLNSLPLPERYNDPSYMNYYTWENPEVMFLFGNQGDVLALPMTTVQYTEYSESGRPTYYTYNLSVVSDSLVNTYESIDLRKKHYLIWEQVGREETPHYYRPISKYEVGSNYGMSWGWSAGNWGIAFKVTEAYLNAAEAAACLYKETGKGEYLTRAGELVDQLRLKRIVAGAFRDCSITDPDKLISFVRDERRRELCFENHRWFDLRRYGMNELKHVWYDKTGNSTEYVLEKNDPGFTLQIPEEAFEHNPAMVQNEPRK